MAVPIMKYTHLLVASGCLYTLYRSAGEMVDINGDVAFGRIVFFGAIYSAMATISFVFMIAHSAGCPILIELELWYDAVLAMGLILSTVQIQKMKERLQWPLPNNETKRSTNTENSTYETSAINSTNSKENDLLIYNKDMLVVNQNLGLLAVVALCVDFLIQMFCTHDFIIGATTY